MHQLNPFNILIHNFTNWSDTRFLNCFWPFGVVLHEKAKIVQLFFLVFYKTYCWFCQRLDKLWRENSKLYHILCEVTHSMSLVFLYRLITSSFELFRRYWKRPEARNELKAKNTYAENIFQILHLTYVLQLQFQGVWRIR